MRTLAHRFVSPALPGDIVGTDGPDPLSGTAGPDRIFGGDGNDTIVAGAGDDLISGQGGTDDLSGGFGNDIYVDAAGDIIHEFNLGGIDTLRSPVTAALPLAVENLVLTGLAAANGSGNELDNRLAGNAGMNFLWGFSGNDTLTGGGGADFLVGGTEDDTYLNPGSAIVLEDTGANGGLDTVVSDTTYSLFDAPYVEQLLLGGAAAIDGTGNNLANLVTGNDAANLLAGYIGNDTLVGGGGDDTLAGQAGTDDLRGGAGDDTYINPNGDTIAESSGGGIDTVESLSSLSLAAWAEVERLLLTGTADIDASGNGGANLLRGNAGANVLNGFAGDDSLEGGLGADRLNGGDGADRLTGGDGPDRLAPGVDSAADILAFAAPGDSTGPAADTVWRIDLAGEDRFDLPSVPGAIAPSVGGAPLSAASFDADLAAAVGAAALPAGAAVLFDPSGGDLDAPDTIYLIVDANGVAGYQPGADFVARLEHLAGTLSLDDFL